MGQPYVGEIRMFAGNFAINGWAFCDGSLQPIDQNPTLFNLIGTTYGGDGQTTFALPNLSGRLPVHMGQGQGLSNYVLGQLGGAEAVTLTTQQMPSHTHPPSCNSGPGNQQGPGNGVWAAPSTGSIYSDQAPNVSLDTNRVPQTAGGSQPHDNMMPYLVVNFIISLFGIFPSQT